MLYGEDINPALIGLDGTITYASQGSRAEFEKYMQDQGFPAHIRTALLSGTMRLADQLYYSIKEVQGANIKFFQTQDSKEIGITNMDKGRLAKDQPLLVSGIVLLQAKITPAGATPSKAEIMNADFKSISDVPVLCTGVTTLSAKKKDIVSELPNYVFRNENMSYFRIGYYKLDNPRIIKDQDEIVFEIDLGTAVGVPPNTYLFAGLHGTHVIP